MSVGVTYLPESPQLVLRLLEGHAALCIKLQENCTHARAKRVLRQLAADLLIETERRRATINLREAFRQRMMVPAE